jgi:hypothetical protein
MSFHPRFGTFAVNEATLALLGGWWPRLPLIASLYILLWTAVMSPQSAVAQQRSPSVWYSPDDDTPDLLDMFTRPQQWSVARSHISVFKFGPQHFELHSKLQRNSLGELDRVGAFEKLRMWGISLASEEGAVKEWDCTGIAAADVTLDHIRNVQHLHGEIGLIAMDEPLVSGLGPCKLPITVIARNTERYMERVRRVAGSSSHGRSPLIGDIEPYPSISVTGLELWLDALSAQGVRLAFLHLDIDLNYLETHPSTDVVKDLSDLQRVLIARGIPFGIIIWSGRDPVVSDEVYYRNAMMMVDLVKRTLNLPVDLIFQSWVHRLSHDCTSMESTFCTGKSIPLNLPEGDLLKFSHTRLVNDALARFAER